MTTIIPVLTLHHEQKYYPEPERFDPEQFNEDVNAKRHQYLFTLQRGSEDMYRQVSSFITYAAVQTVLGTKESVRLVSHC